ncbi:hypothetical protein PCCS19_11290 [Paenibacillus sp. CCS19]|nr:hypothetical protein PCCS19_11290 [Paenibacillus cellulosilyticus]
MEAFEAYVEVGQILTGLSIEEPIKSLELKFEKQPLLPKLVIAWGLMNGYQQQKELLKSKKMIEFCELNAPHCTLLIKPIKAIQEEINFA